MITVKIRRDSDPFKKYWWVLLLAFGAVGGWICLPMMESGTGSAAVSREGGLKSLDQSLDSLHNPSGAPGSAVDLSMDGTGAYRKKTDGPITSSLYQPPPEEAPAPSEAGPKSESNLANALKDISKKTASYDPTGWGGARAQKGFTPPKANFGSLSGTGGGSGSAASFSGGASSGGSGLGAFGTPTAKTGLAATRGLGQGAGEAPRGGVRSYNALQAASAQGIAAATQRSADAAAAMSGQSFDGGGSSARISGAGGGIEGAGMLAKLDSAPVNLKMSDPKLSRKELTPPAKPVEEKKENFREKMMQMIMMMVVGGLVGPMMGGLTKMILPF